MTKIQMEKLLKHYLRTQIEPEIIRVASEMFRSGTLDTSSIPKDDQTVIKALTYISLDRAKALTHPLGPEGQAMVRDLEFAGQVEIVSPSGIRASFGTTKPLSFRTMAIRRLPAGSQAWEPLFVLNHTFQACDITIRYFVS